MKWHPRRADGAALVTTAAGSLEGLDNAGQPILAEVGRPGLQASSPGVQALLAQLEALASMRHPHVERVVGWGYFDSGDGSGEQGNIALLTEPHVCGSAADLFARLAAPECRRAQQASARRCPAPPLPPPLPRCSSASANSFARHTVAGCPASQGQRRQWTLVASSWPLALLVCLPNRRPLPAPTSVQPPPGG